MSGVKAGIAAGVLAVTAIAVAPAFGASEPGRPARHVAPLPSAAFGSFTPAAADPRLAAAFARSGLDGDSFRFTPAETRRATRAVTVAIRSRASRPTTTVAVAERMPTITSTTVGLAPIAYNLGLAVGWKRFSVAGDVARIDLLGQPGSRESADVGVSYSLNRFTGRVRGSYDRPLANGPRLTEEPEGVSLDVGGSYSLTRRLDVTAGLRYHSELDRLQQAPDSDRRDSRAVYVGTAFRF